jgi:hypothetical protein
VYLNEFNGVKGVKIGEKGNVVGHPQISHATLKHLWRSLEILIQSEVMSRSSTEDPACFNSYRIRLGGYWIM